MKVFVKTHSWKKFEDSSDEPEQGYYVEAYGHNQASEPCLIRINDYNPHFYAELPDRVWRKSDIELIEEHLKSRLGGHAPVKCILVNRKKLFFFRDKKTYPLLLLAFKNEEALRHCSNMIKKPIAPNGLPRIQLTPREADVGQVKKLCAMRKITYVGWLECEAVELPIGHEDRISSDNGFTHEYVVSWRTLAPVPEAICSLWAVYPTIMSWDIEVLSYNPKVFPSAMRVRDESFMIGVTIKRLGQTTGVKHIILVYGPHDELPDTEVRRFDSELAVIFGFCDLINEENPDVLLTYNGLTFDFKYLNRRLLNILEAWKPCGRILGRKPELVSLEWKSSAYGIQEIVYVAMDGRISVDMFPIIQRDFKLDKYTLDFCSFYFLKKNKAPVSPEDIFRYYKIAQGYSFPEIAEACRGSTTFPFLLEFRLHTDQAVHEVIEAYETHRGTEAVVEAVLSIYRKYQPTVMAVIGHYCIIDTVRPIELFEKLNTWVGLSELAQIVKVQLMDTFTRGQQIRVFSQLYDYIYEEGYYIDSRLPTNLPFVGGYVHKPIPGLYRDVVSFDFASLYPSIILAYNICYTTFVPEGSNVPDEMCNVIEWEEEGGEEASAPGEEAGEVGGVELEVDEEGNAIPKMTTKRKYRFRFIKADIHMGIFPKFLQHLLTKRRATRDIMENEVEYSFNWNILNARQGALKVSANSGYGFLGVRKSKLPLLEAALCVTAMGRMNIHKIMDAVIAEGGQQVYGDSVSADTPILIRCNGEIGYHQISDIANFTTLFDETSLEKQVIGFDGVVEVWSDKGWTPIKRVIRHRVEKQMYRILTSTGVVDVTEDHSLLDLDSNEIRPRDVAIGTRLLHHDLPVLECVEGELTEGEAYELGVLYSQTAVMTMPSSVLSSPIKVKQAFIDGYGHTGSFIQTGDVDKLKLASLYLLRKSVSDTESNPHAIKKIIPLPHKEQWVYDLETENHHFSAGIGEMVVHNTDSAMIHFSNVTRENLYAYGREMARKLSLDLPKPMKIEFERAYASFFSVSAKRYACVVLQENGIPQPNEDKLYKRGIILARRDNCILLRELYKAVLLCIVYERGAEQALDQLMYYTNLLMSASVPLAKLIIIKSIAASYKSESNVMAVFGRRLKAMGKNVQGGDRLEYVYCEAEEKLQGYKLALPEMVITEPEKYKLDRPYYFEKSFIKPIQQLLEIGFNFKKGYMKEIHKCILKKQVMCRQIAEMGEEARKKAEAGRVKLRIIRR